MFLPAHPDRAYTIIEADYDDDSEESAEDEDEIKYKWGYYTIPSVALGGEERKKSLKAKKDSDDEEEEQGEEEQSEQESYGSEEGKTFDFTEENEFKCKEYIQDIFQNKELSQVFILANDGESGFFFDVESGELKSASFGVNFELRHNQHLFSDFVGSFFDQFNTKHIGSFTKLQANEMSF